MQTTRLAALAALLCMACNGQPPDAPHGGLEPMPQTLELQALGLYLTDNPLSAPPGSLVTADDAVIWRNGIIETRRGNRPEVSLGAYGDLTALTAFGGYVLANTSDDLMVYRTGSTSVNQYNGTFAAPSTGQRMRFLEAQGNLYAGTSAGVKRLTTPLGTWEAAGVPPGLEGTSATSGSTGFLDSGSAVAYRFVWGMRDGNGNLHLGPPSGRLLVSYASTATGTVTLTGGAGDVTITVGGTAVGPVAFNVSDAQTATDCITALNANATVAALVTASSGGSGIILLTADTSGPTGDTITLTASRTAGAATASGATLSGGSETRDVDVTIPVPTGITSGTHFVQVYRTETRTTTAGDPGEEMAMVAELFPTGAEVTAGSLTYTDVATSPNGATAYFSPSQGGIINAKDAPPSPRDMALFKGYTFYAVECCIQRAQMTLLAVGGSEGMIAGDGIRFEGDGWYENYAANVATESAATGQFLLTTSGTASQNIEATARSLVRVINGRPSGRAYASYASGPNDPPGVIIIQARSLTDTEFEIAAVSADEYWSPATRVRLYVTNAVRTANVTTLTTFNPHKLAVGDQIRVVRLERGVYEFTTGTFTVASTPTTTTFTYSDVGGDIAAGGVDSDQIVALPNDVLYTDDGVATDTWAYSAFEEPEAVPLGNYFNVASGSVTLYRIVPLADSLLFWTSGGIYRLSGTDENDFTLRPLDTTVSVIAPDSVVAMGNRQWALTEEGVVSVTDTGVERVSQPIDKVLLELRAAFIAANKSAEFSAMVHGVAYETEKEYRLWLPTSTSDTYATQAYVFNANTRTWVRHTTDARAGIVNPTEDVQYLAGGATARFIRERKTRTASDYADADGVGVPFSVVYAANVADNPGGTKQWSEVGWLLEPTAPATLGISLYTEVSSSPESGTSTTNGLPYVRSYVPVNKARSSVLYVGASHSTAGERASLTGISVVYNGVSTRLR